MKKIITFFLIFLSCSSYSQIRISQVYGGGGNASATYNQDFIELFNAGATSVDISGWSVQYSSAAGTTWAATVIPAATNIGSGKYFLVGLASGVTGIALPTPDLTGASNLSGSAGKVALVNVSVALSGATACSNASVIDVVGYGATASCSETSPVITTGIDNTKSFLRGSGGCTESNNNSVDFTVGLVSPRNSSTAASPCATGPTLSAGPAITTLSSILGAAGTPLSFTLSGSNLTGFPGNISVTASTNFEVSLSSGSGYAASINVPFTSATLSSTTVYVRITASAPQGALSGTVTNAGGGASSDAVVNISGGVYQNYYNTKANLGLTNTGTWSSTLNGSGSSPANFSTAYQLFNIVNQANANYTGIWDVSNAGNTTRVVVGDNSAPINFTILPGVDSVTSATRIDVMNNATLILQNNRRPFLNSMATGSTVEFAQTGLTSADTIKVPALSYHHLTLSNGIKILSSGTTTIRGSFTLNNVVNFNGAPSPFSTVNSFGDITVAGTTTFEPQPTGDAARITLAMNGNVQTITSNGNDLLFFRLRRDTTSVDGTVQFAGSACNLVLGNTAGGGLQLNQGTTTNSRLNLGSNTFTLTGAAVSTNTSLGKISSTGGNINILKLAGTTNAGTIRFVAGSTVNNFIMNLDPAVTKDSVIIADSLTITGTLSLTKGKIVLASGKVLSLGAAATVTGGSVNSFVDGILSKTGATAFTFHVGKGIKYAPTALANLSGSNTYNVLYLNTGYGNYTVNPATTATYPNYNLSPWEWWKIDQAAAGTVDITFNYTDANSHILAPASIRMAHFGASDWNDIGGTAGGSNTTTNGYVTVAGVSSFSPFTFSAANPGVIPVKFGSFAVKKLNNQVLINWVTEQEINSSKFIVERYSNGVGWTPIAVVPAAGNSSIRVHYSITDNSPVKGINFYRIRQVDQLDRFEFSAIRSVLFNADLEALVTPNPANNILNIYADNQNRTVGIVILDESGKIVRSLESDQPLTTINVSSLARGIYFVKIMNEGKATVSRILLQ